MVGMDAQVIYEESKDRNGVYEGLEPCAQANGNLIFHSEDSGSPPMTGVGEGNTKGSALCPITPTPRRENGDSIFVMSSPLSVETPQSPNVGGFKSTKNVEIVASGLDDSPHTPDEGVFDPFAPGTDEMLLAPICKRLVEHSQKIVARRLNFDDTDDFNGDDYKADTLSEKALLESVYGTLLEAIILKQSEEFFAENGLEMEGVCTPTSPPPLTGVAETCPGAPLKVAAGKSRNIERGLCRKLEF